MGPLHSHVALIHLIFLKICKFFITLPFFLVVLDKVLMLVVTQLVVIFFQNLGMH